MSITRQLTILAVSMITAAAATAAPRQIARPFGHFTSDDVRTDQRAAGARGATDPLADGAQHIVDQQCPSGGFGWPHDSCTSTSPNITAPILLGVIDAHSVTAGAGLVAAAEAGGDHDLAWTFDNDEARFGTFTAGFLDRLSLLTGDRRFAEHAATSLFGRLADGTYGPDDLDTAAWIQRIEDGRAGLYINLRPWEFHTLIPAARRLGNTGQETLFVDAVLAGLETLDRSDPATASHDLIGLAGAVRGLAFAGTTSFPPISAPLCDLVDGADGLDDLVVALLDQQNDDGSWNWHSNLPTPDTSDADVQTTAYAVLALAAADALVTADLRQAMVDGRDWMLALQGVDGSVPEWPGGPENTEVEGEFLSAVVAVGNLVFVDGFESGALTAWSATTP